MAETELSERLRLIRRDRNLSQKEVSSELHIKQSVFSGYETGEREPNFKVIVKIAQFYNVTTDYLLGASNIMRNDYQTHFQSLQLQAKENLNDSMIFELDKAFYNFSNLIKIIINRPNFLVINNELCGLIQQLSDFINEKSDMINSFERLQTLQRAIINISFYYKLESVLNNSVQDNPSIKVSPFPWENGNKQGE